MRAIATRRDKHHGKQNSYTAATREKTASQARAPQSSTPLGPLIIVLAVLAWPIQTPAKSSLTSFFCLNKHLSIHPSIHPSHHRPPLQVSGCGAPLSLGSGPPCLILRTQNPLRHHRPSSSCPKQHTITQRIRPVCFHALHRRASNATSWLWLLGPSLHTMSSAKATKKSAFSCEPCRRRKVSLFVCLFVSPTSLLPRRLNQPLTDRNAPTQNFRLANQVFFPPRNR